MSLAQMRQAPVHPGEVFRDRFREPSKISQAEAARRLGISNHYMNLIETTRRPVSTEMAVKFEALTGASAEFWATLQMRYDLWHALQAAKDEKGGPIPGESLPCAYCGGTLKYKARPGSASVASVAPGATPAKAAAKVPGLYCGECGRRAATPDAVKVAASISRQ